MTLIPTLAERIARARTDIRMGLPVVLSDGDTKSLVAAAEGLGDDRLNTLRAAGEPVLVLTARRAETLRTVPYDGDIVRIAIPADANAAWVAAAADPKDDLAHPLKGPFNTLREGDATTHRLAINLTKSAHVLPAAVVVDLTGEMPADLTELAISSLSDALQAPAAHTQIVTGRVPIAMSQAGRVHVFRPRDGGEDHVVCEIGNPSREEPVLVRLHSACFTGDVLGSLKCDCGPQLHGALQQMGEAGKGVLLYLSQEGRGIGLANKLRAYSLQDQGFDTVEANHRLGFEDDERDFRTGADLLKRLGFKSVKLLTNNPAKVAMIEAQGISVVERVPLRVGRGPLNSDYLDVKAKKSGHIL